jgi:hypothetical protein
MRVALLLLCVPAMALADDQRSVERIVKSHITSLAKRPKDDQLGVAPNALVMVYGTDKDAKLSISDARGGLSGAVAHAIGGDTAVGVDSDHGVAWFQAPFSVDITPTGAPMGDPSMLHTKERFGGVAVLGKNGWQIAVAMYARMLDDAQLAALGKEHGDGLPAGEPKLTGDKGLDSVVGNWIKAGFAGHAATDVTLIASGTATSEYGSGDAAKSLAKTFDGLHLKAATIDGRTYADGALGYARAKIAMPVKTGGAVEMLLGVTAIWQDKEWRWVSLQYSAVH